MNRIGDILFFVIVYSVLFCLFNKDNLCLFSRRKIVIRVLLSAFLCLIFAFFVNTVTDFCKIDILWYLFYILMNIFVFFMMYNVHILDINQFLLVKKRVYLFGIFMVFLSFCVICIVNRFDMANNNLLLWFVLSVVVSVLLYLFLRCKLPGLLVQVDLRRMVLGFIFIIAISGLEVSFSLFFLISLIYVVNKYVFKLYK